MLDRLFARQRPITAAEAGRRGAIARHKAERAPILAKATAMRASSRT